jgi:uncharacterized protein (DUF924 family)
MNNHRYVDLFVRERLAHVYEAAASGKLDHWKASRGPDLVTWSIAMTQLPRYIF